MDLKTGCQLGFKSTANALRSNSFIPYPGVGNIELSGGNLTLEDLLNKANESSSSRLVSIETPITWVLIDLPASIAFLSISSPPESLRQIRD